MLTGCNGFHAIDCVDTGIYTTADKLTAGLATAHNYGCRSSYSESANANAKPKPLEFPPDNSSTITKPAEYDVDSHFYTSYPIPWTIEQPYKSTSHLHCSYVICMFYNILFTVPWLLLESTLAWTLHSFILRVSSFPHFKLSYIIFMEWLIPTSNLSPLPSFPISLKRRCTSLPSELAFQGGF